MTEADAPDAPAFWTQVEQRGNRIDRDMHKIRMQMIFLFAFLVIALVLAAIRAQLNADRIELERWQLCQGRVAGINAYNSILPDTAIKFPVPDCGPDPRTD